MELSAGDISGLAHGEVVQGSVDARASSWSVDSRTLQPGAAFFALVADRDGHEFVGHAFARGASVAVVDRPIGGPLPDGATVVQVTDTLHALTVLGRAARSALHDATVVGVTGSSGKTATKNLVAAALGGNLSVHASPASHNNEIGVPLTLLDAPAAVEALVLEMGARALGNIADLCAIAAPNAAIVTNIGLAHVEFLRDRDGVADVKGELLEALPSAGLAVLDAGDEYTPALARRTAARVLRVGVEGAVPADADLDVVASGVELDAELRPSFVLRSAWGAGPVSLGVRGAHQVVNATLAAAVALAVGVPFEAVASGLTSVRPARWRMEVGRSADGVLVIDDAYNANPASVAAALEALARVAVAGRRVAVLGEMLELGEHADAEHARVGALAATLGIDALVAVGTGASATAAAAREGAAPVRYVVEVSGPEAALAAVSGIVGPGDAVLVKGSRRVGLEVVAAGLRARGGPA
jgi:UDP-N-acetylmuramoyl-tripeptide--D-alanyl-D-alanine ligase